MIQNDITLRNVHTHNISHTAYIYGVGRERKHMIVISRVNNKTVLSHYLILLYGI